MLRPLYDRPGTPVADRPLLILGGGGHGNVVCDIAVATGRHNIQVCDPGLTNSRTANGHAVSRLKEPEFIRAFAAHGDFVVAIGDAMLRRSVFERLTAAGASLATLIHPSAVVSPHASTGAGTVVMARVVINANARVGSCAIVNSGAIVEHDCDIADGVHISPGAMLGGAARVGQWSWIGMGAVLLPQRRVGQFSIVGAGSVVTRDVPDEVTVFGNPARIASK